MGSFILFPGERLSAALHCATPLAIRHVFVAKHRFVIYLSEGAAMT